jgi:pyruvate-formate lyase-activating enzyme
VLESFDTVVTRLLVALRRAGLPVTRLELGSAGELRFCCRRPFPDLVLEDAADAAPAGPSASLGAFRLVALPGPAGADAPAEALPRARAVFTAEWAGLSPWLAPEPEGPFAPQAPVCGDWRVGLLETTAAGTTLVLRSPRGELRLSAGPAGDLLAITHADSDALRAEAARWRETLAFLLHRAACAASRRGGATRRSSGAEGQGPPLRVVTDLPIGTSATRGAAPEPPAPPAWQQRPARVAPASARIALVTGLDTESFHTFRRPPFPSLGPARLAGYLRERGVERVSHLELGYAVRRWLAATGRAADFGPFADEAAVDAYLHRSASGPISEAVEQLLVIADLPPADLFGLSLVRREDDHRLTEPLIALDLCLVHGLKRRYPGCVTALGGLHFVNTGTMRESQIGLLRRCPSLDFVVEGPGEVALYNIVRAVFAGQSLDALGQPHERTGRQYRLYPVADGAEGTVGPKRRIPRKADVELPGGYPLAAYYGLPRATPAFVNADDYRMTGRELADLYAFPPALRDEIGPRLDRTILPLTLQFVTGCSGICAYCAAGNVQPRALPVDEVVRQVLELKERHGAAHFIFMNNSVNWSYDYATSLADALIRARAGILWVDSLQLHGLDDRLVGKLRESGLVRADIGVEAASQRLRRAVHKPLTPKAVAEKLRLLGRHGIWADINVIVGLPHEERSDIEETIRFLEETAPYYMACTINPFRLIDNSPMGHAPGAFGIAPRPGRRLTGVGWRMAFDEAPGLEFEARDDWAMRASDEIRALVASLGPPPYCSTSNTIPYHLIFLLYEAFGHDGSRRIRQIYGDLFRGLAEAQAAGGRLSLEPGDARQPTAVR